MNPTVLSLSPAQGRLSVTSVTNPTAGGPSGHPVAQPRPLP